MSLSRLSAWWLLPLIFVAGVAFTAGVATGNNISFSAVAVWAETPPPPAKAPSPPPSPPACDSPAFTVFGRCNGRGYLSNFYHNPYYPSFSFDPYSWYWVNIPRGINATQFINETRNRLFNNTITGCLNQQAWNTCTRNKAKATGAAFIVGTMLGRNGTANGSGNSGITNGVTWARNNFSRWEQLVRDYDAAGRVDWDIRLEFAEGHRNSIQIRWGDDTTIGTHGHEFEWSIRFRGPGGEQYIIKKNCGNLTGRMDILPQLTYQNEPRVIPDRAIVHPGATYTFAARVRNEGTLQSPALRLIVKQTRGDTQDPRSANQSSPVAATTLGYPGSTADCANKQPCWFWTYPDLGISQSRSPPFTFTVADTAANLSQICFVPYARPHTRSVTEKAGSEVCVTVIEPDKPFVSTEEGDVHAGAIFGINPCLQPPGSIGHIRGRLFGDRGSSATYAVSAGADIRNFKSAKDRGSQSGSDQLTFGNVGTLGQYGVICREDAYAKNKDRADTTLSGSQVLAQGNIDNRNGLVRVTGDLTLAGQITVAAGKKLTFVVDGNVHIVGPQITNQSTGLTFDNLPAFGIIAKRNIFIGPAVTRLDGIYSAGSEESDAEDGVIDTCRNSLGNGSSSDFSPLITQPGGAVVCQTNLLVNGMLTAREMYFRRTGGDVVAASPSELVRLNGLLYLAPPPGFGPASLQLNQGERPPVF